ncbi:MAG: hypothetical protein HY403_07855 [Elusimicrobia bacterium]|nr:hypothetical protein [Elusimicrobiota bacterium]
MSPRIAAVVLLLFMGGCGREESGTNAACPHDPGFDRSQVVRVRADAPPAVLRRDLDLAALAVESGGLAGPCKAQGLTAVEHRLSFRTIVNAKTSRGRTCVWFEEVSVDLTPASIQIFVPREYPEGSCEYLTVLDHEREHERAHNEHLKAAAEEIAGALTAAKWLPARGNPHEAADRASAEAALNAKIKKVVAPIYDRYKENLASSHAELDKPELYQWVSKRCGGWK